MSVGIVLTARPVLAQPPSLEDTAAEAEQPPFRQEELDQLLAPIALYPDPLLSQVLMAATYPLEIVQADRWVRRSGRPTGEAQARELEKQPWDASVKALTNFPDVLSMMSEELDWTTKLGDAFLGQQEQVMATVQRLRAKARAQGNLRSTEQQVVSVEPVDDTTQIIVIQPADPEVIYIPAYDPWVVYGTWWAPAYGPYYHPMPWFWGGAGLSFGVGIGLGAGWGYAWGYPDWRHRHVYVDPDFHARRHRHLAPEIRHIRRDRYGVEGGRRWWAHQPTHRQGVPYRNRATLERFERTQWSGDRPPRLRPGSRAPARLQTSPRRETPRVQSPSRLQSSPRLQSPMRLQTSPRLRSPTSPQLRGPTRSQSSPRVQSPSRFQSSPRVQSPSRFQSSPRVQSPSRFQTSPRVQSPSRFQSSPRVQSPSRFQTSPRVQSPSRFQTPPRVYSPSRVQGVRPSGPVFRGSRPSGPTFRGGGGVPRSVSPAVRGGGSRGGGRR